MLSSFAGGKSKYRSDSPPPLLNLFAIDADLRKSLFLGVFTSKRPWLCEEIAQACYSILPGSRLVSSRSGRDV